MTLSRASRPTLPISSLVKGRSNNWYSMIAITSAAALCYTGKVATWRGSDRRRVTQLDRSTRVYQRSSIWPTQLLCVQVRATNTQVTAVAHIALYTRVLCLQKCTVRKLTKVARSCKDHWCAYLRLSKKRGDDLHTQPRIVLSISRNTGILNAAVTHTCVNSHNSLPRPQAAQGTSKTDFQGRWVAEQKPSHSIWQERNQPAGDYRGPTVVARAPSDIMRRNSWDIKTSTHDVKPGQGSVSTKVPSTLGVTVAAAPSGFSRPHPVWMISSTLWRTEALFFTVSLQSVYKHATRIIANGVAHSSSSHNRNVHAGQSAGKWIIVKLVAETPEREIRLEVVEQIDNVRGLALRKVTERAELGVVCDVHL